MKIKTNWRYIFVETKIFKEEEEYRRKMEEKIKKDTQKVKKC